MTLSEQYLLRVININTNQLSITVLHHEGGEPQFIQVLIARINNCSQIPYKGISSKKLLRFPGFIVTQSIKSKNTFWTRFIGMLNIQSGTQSLTMTWNMSTIR